MCHDDNAAIWVLAYWKYNATCSGYFLDSGHWTLQHGDVSCKTEGSLVSQVHYMLCNLHSMIELLDCINIYIYTCIFYLCTQDCDDVTTSNLHMCTTTNQQTIHAFFHPHPGDLGSHVTHVVAGKAHEKQIIGLKVWLLGFMKNLRGDKDDDNWGILTFFRWGNRFLCFQLETKRLFSCLLFPLFDFSEENKNNRWSVISQMLHV